jgi:hypothetical protein
MKPPGNEVTSGRPEKSGRPATPLASAGRNEVKKEPEAKQVEDGKKAKDSNSAKRQRSVNSSLAHRLEDSTSERPDRSLSPSVLLSLPLSHNPAPRFVRVHP